MIRLLKHIWQTLLLILVVAFIAMLPKGFSASWLMPVVWGLIALLLIGTGIYIGYGRKKGLFCVVLIGLIFGLSATAFAQADNTGDRGEEGAEYDVASLAIHSSQWCADANSFNVEQAIKQKKNPLKDTYKNTYDQANRYTYAYDLAKARQQNKTWDDKASQYKEALKCAKKFLKKAAEFKMKSNEMAASTVRRVLQKDQDTCWPCGISMLVLTIMEKVSVAVEDSLRSAALDLLGIMLLFWLMYKVAVLIGQWGTANLSEFFTQLLTRFIVAMIASVVLLNTTNLNSVYSTIFSPFIGATSALTKTMVQMDSSPNANSLAIQLGAESNLLQCSCCRNGDSTDCNGGSISDFKTKYGNTTILEKEAKREMMCMTCSVYKQTAPMVAIGRVMTYASTHIGFWTRFGRGSVGAAIGILLGSPTTGAAIAAALPSPLEMWIVGMLLIIIFTILSALIAFKLIDIFLRLGFVLLLTPFLVTTFVFPATRSYTKRGWDFLVNAMLNILALGIGMTFILVCYQTTLPTNTTDTLKTLVAETGDPSNNYAQQLYDAFTGGTAGGAFSTLLILGIFLFFGIKILDASQVIIESLSDTGSGLPSIAGAAVMAGLRALTAPIRMGLTAAMDHSKVVALKDSAGLVNDMAESAGNSVSKGANKAGDAVNRVGQKAGDAVNNLGKQGMKGCLHMCKLGYGLGAIAGLPLMAAIGAGMAANTLAVKGGSWATSKGIKGAGKMTSWGIKRVGKSVQNDINKLKYMGEKIKNLGRNLKTFGRKVKNLANRIRQLPSNIGKKVRQGWNAVKHPSALMRQGLSAIKHAPANIKNRLRKAFRREKAQNKYGRKRPMSRLKRAIFRGTRNGIENLLDAGDEAVGNTDPNAR